MDPIVIDPPNFDQAAAWAECRKWVDDCGGLDETNPSHMRAASGADPGICSCPACGTMYWMWGRVQRCRMCEFEYPTDWWPMYSWGSSASKKSQKSPYRQEERMKHPYYRYGFEHPADDPWMECHKPAWQEAIRNLFAKEAK